MYLQYALPHQIRQALEEKMPLLVPTGCVEYHGPHMPFGADTLIVEELLQRVAGRVNCVIAPPFWYGPTGYAVTGPDQGTVDVSTERFGRHVKDVLGSFWDIGFHWIVVAVHHQQMDGPEALAIRQAAAEIIFEKTHAERGHGWWGQAPLPPDDNVFERIQVWPSVLPAAAAQGAVMADHAGLYETSLVMAARAEWVELDRLGMPEDALSLKPQGTEGRATAPWYSTAPDGKAREASAEAGARMWAAMVDAWVEKLAAVTRPRQPTPKDVTITGLF